MDDYLRINGLPQIQSEQACKTFAALFREAARILDYHAETLSDTRKNARPRGDKYPVIWAANYLLDFHNAGGDTASECRKISSKLLSDSDIIWELFQAKLAAQERSKRKTRNARIIKWERAGLPYSKITARTGLSKGQISKIIARHKKNRVKRV